MKSRITTYILTLVALAVWGLIAWRIFFSLPDTHVTPELRPILGNLEETKKYILRLDYDDPFLKDVAPLIPKTSGTTMPLPSPDEMPLRYLGVISSVRKKSYIFEHAGSTLSLSPGETFEGYTLVEVLPDSVRMVKK